MVRRFEFCENWLLKKIISLKLIIKAWLASVSWSVWRTGTQFHILYISSWFLGFEYVLRRTSGGGIIGFIHLKRSLFTMSKSEQLWKKIENIKNEIFFDLLFGKTIISHHIGLINFELMKKLTNKKGYTIFVGFFPYLLL